MKRKTFALLLVIGAILGIGTAMAATTWDRTITWNKGATTDFTVWTAATDGVMLPSSQSVPLASPPDDPTTLTYYVQNDGNVMITVTPTVTADGASYTLNPLSVAIPVGDTRMSIALTLYGFEVGSGSAAISFASTQTNP